MKILALDLGSKTGWATHEHGHITSGVREFKADRFEGGGMRYLKFKNWLSTIKDMLKGVDLVMFEEVRNHSSPGKGGGRSFNVDAAHAYGGFMASLTAWCEAEKIPYQGVPVGTIKKHATGKGNVGKEQMIAAMRKKGHPDLKDDNEADALAILYYALDVMGPQAKGTIWDGPQAPNMRKPASSCGSCQYEEADGELIAQCAGCKKKDAPRNRVRIVTA